MSAATVAATTVSAAGLVHDAVEHGFTGPWVLDDLDGPAWECARSLADALDGVRLDAEQIRHLAWQIGGGGTTLAGIITAVRAQPQEGTGP